MAKPKGTANGRLVPGMGTVVALDHALLHAEPGQSVMARIAYCHEDRVWKMQEFAGEGMVVFLTSAPLPNHTQFTITNVLATQTSCHAVPEP